MELKDVNLARFVGTLTTELEVYNRMGGVVLYQCSMQVERKSGIYDTVPLHVGERKINQLKYELKAGMRIGVEGQVCTHNQLENDGKTHLKVYVKVTDIFEVGEDVPDQNDVFLSGTVCKKPVFRKTPLGKEITDIILACEFKGKIYGYMPCIAWGCLAQDVSNIKVSTILNVKGRFQSRDYRKKMPDGSKEPRTTYEVSVLELV